MTRSNNNVVYAFAVGNDFGTIQNCQFTPVELDKIRFLRIIGSLFITGKYKVPDLLLKAAIVEYTGAEKIAVLYRGKGITDSAIYMKWRKRVADHKKMAIVTKAYQDEKHRIMEIVRDEKIKASDYNGFKRSSITTTIRRYCRGLPGYNFSGQR
mgnify:FL=1